MGWMSVVGGLQEHVLHFVTFLVSLLYRLFKIKSESIVSACTHCHPYVQPVDVLYMCSLHSVAMEATFKAYMLQMIQDATRLHR